MVGRPGSAAIVHLIMYDFNLEQVHSKSKYFWKKVIIKSYPKKLAIARLAYT
jgi:hypothetical protein